MQKHFTAKDLRAKIETAMRGQGSAEQEITAALASLGYNMGPLMAAAAQFTDEPVQTKTAVAAAPQSTSPSTVIAPARTKPTGTLSLDQLKAACDAVFSADFSRKISLTSESDEDTRGRLVRSLHFAGLSHLAIAQELGQIDAHYGKAEEPVGLARATRAARRERLDAILGESTATHTHTAPPAAEKHGLELAIASHKFGQ